MKICPNCSAQNEDGNLFCLNCGSKLEEEIQQNADGGFGGIGEIGESTSGFKSLEEPVYRDIDLNEGQNGYNMDMGQEGFGSTDSSSSQPFYNDLNTNQNNNVYDTTPSYGESIPSYGAAPSTPAYGESAPSYGAVPSTPAYGESTPSYGAVPSTPVYGESTPSYGAAPSTPPYGNNPGYQSGAQPPYQGSTPPPYQGTYQNYNNLNTDPDAVKPDATPFIIWSVANLVCCCVPLGIASLIVSTQISSAPTIEEAEKKKKTAMMLCIIGTALGFVVELVYALVFVATQ